MRQKSSLAIQQLRSAPDSQTARRWQFVAVVPALNESLTIASVIADLQTLRLEKHIALNEIIIVDNGSTDNTAELATSLGARVIYEPRAGYGSACQTGINAIINADAVLFVDGDHSCNKKDIINVCQRLTDDFDLVIGSRTLGLIEKGAMTRLQWLGNALICSLIRLRFRTKVTDLGPLRAIRFESLKQLNMQDQRFGWTAEMQVKAINKGFRIIEIPVNTTPRLGKSKISGTWRGTLLAGIDLTRAALFMR